MKVALQCPVCATRPDANPVNAIKGFLVAAVAHDVDPRKAMCPEHEADVQRLVPMYLKAKKAIEGKDRS